jgi:hypothetical protein
VNMHRRPINRQGRIGLLTALCAAALLLVPVSQAAAAAGTLKVAVTGSGSGEVSSVGGLGAISGFEEFGNLFEGSPPIECAYASPGPATGACEDEMEKFEGFNGYALRAIPAAGYEFKGWVLVNLTAEFGCGESELIGGSPATYAASGSECGGFEASEAFEGGEAIATFTLEEASLTVNEGGSGSGSVQCDTGSGPETCAPSYPKGTTISIVDTPAAGSEFVEWIGCDAEPSAGVCEIKLEEDSTVEVINDLAGWELTINQTGSGSGTVECEIEGATGPCASKYEGGTEITLVPAAASGSEFGGFENGSGNLAACSSQTSCTFTLEEASEIDARFDLEEESLTINEGGSGSGSVQCDTGSGPEACAPSYPYGTIVSIIDTPASGSHFAGWAGECDTVGGNECEVTMTAAKTVEVLNNIDTGHPLTVWISGSGTVTSPDGTLVCSGEECSGHEFEGTVTLEAHAAGGYTFAGWIGCTHAGATTCTVEVSEATEVTAVFMKEAEDGKSIVIGTATAAECPEGGITVEIAGEPSTKQTICNGEAGTAGTPGTNGKSIVIGTATAAECPEGGITVEIAGEPSTKQKICNGPHGATGAPGTPGQNGAQGPQGPQGGKGDTGAAGAQGPAGPEGKQGPPGKVTVTCKVKGNKVKCTVKQATQRSRLNWSLHRADRTVSHGSTSARRLQRVLEHLRPGRYVLRIAGQNGTVIDVRR